MTKAKKTILLITKAVSFKEGVDKLATSVAVSQNFNLELVTFTKHSLSSEYIIDISNEWDNKVIPLDFNVLNRTTSGIHVLERLFSTHKFEAVFVSGSFGSARDEAFVKKMLKVCPHPVVVCNNEFTTMDKKNILISLNGKLNTDKLVSSIVSITSNKLNCYDFLYVETDNKDKKKTMEALVGKLKTKHSLVRSQLFYQKSSTLAEGMNNVLEKWNYDFFGFVTPNNTGTNENQEYQEAINQLIMDKKQSLISLSVDNKLKPYPEVGYASATNEGEIPQDKTNNFLTLK